MYGHSLLPNRDIFNLRFVGDLADRSGQIRSGDDFVDIADIKYAWAVRLSDADSEKPLRLMRVGDIFRELYERSHKNAHLDKAIEAYQTASRLKLDGYQCENELYSKLGTSLLHRIEYSQNIVDIENAIFAFKCDLKRHADSFSSLENLGSSFLARFQCLGELTDIDEAVSAHQQAVHLIPDGHAAKPTRLSNLGNSFALRFLCLKDSSDLDKAMSAHEQAVHLSPDNAGHLSNLALSLGNRFTHSGDPKDLDKSISALEKAVHFTPDNHLRKPRYLTSLGISLCQCFSHARNPIDIDNAISAHQRAVHLTHDGNCQKPCRLSNLGSSFKIRFEHSKYLIDVDNAISAHQQAVDLTPKDQSHQAEHLYRLANSFQVRFERLDNLDDSDHAISHFQSVAMCFTASPSTRLAAALRWARLASRANFSSSLPGYRVALDLLPLFAWLGLTIPERHRKLSNMDIASEAAAAAISAEQYNTALEWLEQGRSIVWSQILHLRSPVDALRELQPSLADNLIRVSRDLECAGCHGDDAHDPPVQNLSIEAVAQRRRRLAEKWEALIKEVRGIPGFDDFLRPKKLVQLLNAAKAGPVVVVNVNEDRCDALVVVPGLDEVLHIPLHEFSYKECRKLCRSLLQLLQDAGVRVRDKRGMSRVKSNKVGSFQRILSTLWLYVVKPVLDGLAFSVRCSFPNLLNH